MWRANSLWMDLNFMNERSLRRLYLMASMIFRNFWEGFHKHNINYFTCIESQEIILQNDTIIKGNIWDSSKGSLVNCMFYLDKIYFDNFFCFCAFWQILRYQDQFRWHIILLKKKEEIFICLLLLLLWYNCLIINTQININHYV